VYANGSQGQVGLEIDWLQSDGFAHYQGDEFLASDHLLGWNCVCKYVDLISSIELLHWRGMII
jgi:hypothetical protein